MKPNISKCIGEDLWVFFFLLSILVTMHDKENSTKQILELNERVWPTNQWFTFYWIIKFLHNFHMFCMSYEKRFFYNK